MQQLGCQLFPGGLGRELPGPPSKSCCHEACSSPSQWDCQGERAGQREGCRAQGSGNFTEQRQGEKAGQRRAGVAPVQLGCRRAGLSAPGLRLPPGSQCVAGASPRRFAAAAAFVSVPAAAAAGAAAAVASHGARPCAAGRSEKTRSSGTRAHHACVKRAGVHGPRSRDRPVRVVRSGVLGPRMSE